MSPEICIPQTRRTLYTKSFNAACALRGCWLFQLAYLQSAKKKETTAENPSLYSSQGKHRRLLLNGPSTKVNSRAMKGSCPVKKCCWILQANFIFVWAILIRVTDARIYHLSQNIQKLLNVQRPFLHI